jgi:broad specificity polyphosphatase/5'/3'-nucleotidase SurE
MSVSLTQPPGSLDAEPAPRTTPCQYNSCPANSGPVGNNATRPDLNWVNSYPVTSIRYGIDVFAPQRWSGQKPELAVTGPNVGSNLWLQVPFSGTVGAAVYAAKEARIPSIAFSSASEGTLAFNTLPVPARSTVNAALAAKLVAKIISSGKPYLPEDVWLNVNFPEVNAQCDSPEKFKWVLSRINPGWLSLPDTRTCGSTRLPTETDVSDTEGCYISVSVGDANDKTTAPAAKQAVVLSKLKDMLVCLP